MWKSIASAALGYEWLDACNILPAAPDRAMLSSLPYRAVISLLVESFWDNIILPAQASQFDASEEHCRTIYAKAFFCLAAHAAFMSYAPESLQEIMIMAGIISRYSTLPLLMQAIRIRQYTDNFPKCAKI